MSGSRTQLFQLTEFKGQNNQAGRSAIDDQEMYWSENLQPIGPGNLALLGDSGSAIWTASGSLKVVAFYCYVRGSQRYAIVFQSDGSAVEITLPGGTATTVAGAGTFSSSSPYVPRIAPWGSSGILILTTGGYWAWDGTLHAAGAASPSWLNGGTATNMPSGVSGNAITVYQSRAIIANGAKISISAPSNGATFAASSGGTTFASSDPFLQQSFMDLLQSSGFLYLFGDSSVNALSNVQTTTPSSGSPVTTFYNANVDPQVGNAYPFAGTAFGRALCFANPVGIFALLGGAAQKVSHKLDNLWATVTTSVVPSLGIAVLNGVKCLVALAQVTDVFGTLRTLLMIWDGGKWFVASQTTAPVQIATSMNFSNPQLWATDGAHLYQCFAASPSGRTARLTTKMYAGQDPLAVKSMRSVFLDMTGSAATATVTADSDRGQAQATVAVSPDAVWTNGSDQTVTWENSSSEDVTWNYSGEQIQGAALSASGLLLGLDIAFTAKALNVVRVAASFDELAVIGR